MNAVVEHVRAGRAPSTSRDALSRVALGLFEQHGFDETTVDDIARAAGIGRRTFFRYFTTKNDLPWGDFDGLVARLRTYLADLPTEIPLADGLRLAILDFNRFPAAETVYHRRRMTLLLNVPSLVAHSTIRYEAWREAIAEFASQRLAVPANDFRPRAVGWTCLALCLASYEEWLQHDDADLTLLLDRSVRLLAPLIAEMEAYVDEAAGR